VTRAQLLALAVVSALLAAVAIAIVDQPVARWLAARPPSSLWSRLVAILEYPAGIEPWPFTMPIVLTAGVVASLAVARWRRAARSWMYVALVYLIARNLMAWTKTLTGRLRPREWLPHGGATFGHLGDGVAFPSGHVVVFAALALPLAVIAPRTRPLLAVVAFVMVARVAVNAHYVSDVLAGLALVALVAWACAPVRAPAASCAPASVQSA
jgi:membrane-associated phospholipid phosphatase